MLLLLIRVLPLADLNNNGTTVANPDEPGYGNVLLVRQLLWQFGMALYSKYPIDTDNIRTF